MWKKCAALPKNTLFIRRGCGAERLQQSVDTSQHIGRRFYLIKYTQNGSCPRGGRRIDDSVQTLGEKNTFIHKVRGSTSRDSLKKTELEDALKRGYTGSTQALSKLPHCLFFYLNIRQYWRFARLLCSAWPWMLPVSRSLLTQNKFGFH